MYYLLVVNCQSKPYFSAMCLEKALTIEALLSHNICPYEYLEYKKDLQPCSVLCKGTFTTKENYMCVAYNISFKLNKTLTSRFRYFNCKIPECLIEVIDLECTLNNYFGNYSNKTSESIDDQKKGTNGSNGFCNDPGTAVVISISCLVGGSLIGISAFVLVKRLRTYKQRLQPPPVFYQLNYGDGGDLTGERTVTIASPLETEYADIEETIRMVAKAIQVPSYKEDSSSETRSRENIYHHLSLTEDSTKRKSSMVSSDSIPDSFADDVISSNKDSLSLKSFEIYTESSSSKSKGAFKGSPGSQGHTSSLLQRR